MGCLCMCSKCWRLSQQASFLPYIHTTADGLVTSFRTMTSSRWRPRRGRCFRTLSASSLVDGTGSCCAVSRLQYDRPRKGRDASRRTRTWMKPGCGSVTSSFEIECRSANVADWLRVSGVNFSKQLEFLVITINNSAHGYAQNRLHAFPRNFPVEANVANLLPTFGNKSL